MESWNRAIISEVKYCFESFSEYMRVRDYSLRVSLKNVVSGKVIIKSANGTDLEDLAYWAINKIIKTKFIITDKITQEQDGKFIVELKVLKPDVSVRGVGESKIEAFINAYLEVINMKGCMKNEQSS